MEIFVGTSGWFYDWNLGKNFTWFVENSGLNAVELNASFYRFPFPNQIKSWAEKGKNIRFAIKVNRRITHIHRLKGEALAIWKSFQGLFSPLESNIDFYLFQFPPSFRPESFAVIEEFFKQVVHKQIKFALEFRNGAWFQDELIKKIERLKLIFVSLDSPKQYEAIYKTNGIIYLRFHGRTSWDNHNYNEGELKTIAKKCLNLRPKKIYAFFNNNHHMLENAQTFSHFFSTNRRDTKR
ncbi:MAG: DUF72 domain-containing protein [Desulfobacterota bacterium]|nr:DUF72 domain-containing protein [Thermodesulfobacteriota bacterium]